MNINFREAAREFCREKQFFNVDLIEQAMVRSAELVVEDTTKRLHDVTDQMVARREKANAPQ